MVKIKRGIIGLGVVSSLILGSGTAFAAEVTPVTVSAADFAKLRADVTSAQTAYSAKQKLVVAAREALTALKGSDKDAAILAVEAVKLKNAELSKTAKDAVDLAKVGVTEAQVALKAATAAVKSKPRDAVLVAALAAAKTSALAKSKALLDAKSSLSAVNLAGVKALSDAKRAVYGADSSKVVAAKAAYQSALDNLQLARTALTAAVNALKVAYPKK